MALDNFNSMPLFNETDIWVIFDTAKQYASFVIEETYSEEVSYDVLRKCICESIENHLKAVLQQS